MLGPLNLELQRVVSCLVGAGNQPGLLREHPVLLSTCLTLEPLSAFFFACVFEAESLYITLAILEFTV